MTSDTERAVYGVLGYPVKHSLSPQMHNAAFAHLGLHAEYLRFEIPPHELDTFLKLAAARGIRGFNVTLPYKEKVMAHCASLSPEAKLIGAVNTVRVTPQGLAGHNTDGAGFLRHVREDIGFDPSGKVVAVVGAGGASRAISVFLAQCAPKRISLYDMDHEKCRALCAHLTAHFKNVEIRSAPTVFELNVPYSDFLVNATPLGMKPDDPLPVDPSMLHRGLLVYDAVYNPPETKLLAAARAQGCMVASGLGMLLYQGMVAFELWTGRDAPKEVMWAALRA